MKKKPAVSSGEFTGDNCGRDIEKAVEILAGGGIVAFPTETCYGLAVDPFNDRSLQRLFAVKHRPVAKPVLLLIDDISLLDSLVTDIPEIFYSLMELYWPGPLTLIFPARPDLSVLLTGGTGTVGVRISPHPIALSLGRKFGKAMTATSANIANQPPAFQASDVVASFGRTIDYVLDGGQIPFSPCSTIMCEKEGRLHLLRQGAVHVGQGVWTTE